MPYASVSISALNSYTESISPSVGSYKDLYKKGDKFDLKIEVNENFQFVKWISTPEESVSFENAAENNTTATIIDSESSIVIQPLVYERNTVTFEPNNALVQPKNIPIVISFTKPIEVTPEDLQKITVSMDDISIREYYQEEIFISEDKKTIKIIPRRDKLLDLVSDINIIKVTVPASFYYLKDDAKITLGKDVVYSFKINSNTETQATISFNCSASEGELTYSNTKTYNLDDEIVSTCIPTEKYFVSGWSVVYSDGNFVEETILDVKQSDDNQTVTIKVLIGSEKEIIVSPICVLRDFLSVDFNSDYGLTVPSESKHYYAGQKFSVNYREIPDYQFIGWKVYDAVTKLPVNDILKIESPSSVDTECTVLKTDTVVILKAECAIRPKVFAMTPSFTETGVPWNSKIRIIFSQQISENSIYFSKTELDDLSISEDNRLPADCKDKNGNDLYYAYLKNGTKNYKNIQIKKRGTNQSLLEYFGKPALDFTDKSVLFIPVLENSQHIQWKEIEVYIDQKLCDSNGISLKEPFSNFYYTNADKITDTIPPTFDISDGSIEKEDNQELIIYYKGVIEDGGDNSKIKLVTASLVPCDYTTNYSCQKIYSEKLYPEGKQRIDFSSEPLIFNFGKKEKIVVGKYKLVLSSEDNHDNVNTRETEVYFENRTIRQPIKDDLFCTKTIFHYDEYQDVKFYLTDYLNTDLFSYNNCEYCINIIDPNSGNEIKTYETWIDTNSFYTFPDGMLEFFKVGKSHGPHDLILHIRPKNYKDENDVLNLRINNAITRTTVLPKVTFNRIGAVIGRGAYVTITITTGDNDVKEIVTDIKNEGQTACVITGVDLYKKMLNGTFSSTVFVYDGKFEKNNSYEMNILFRGLETSKPVVGTIYVVDTEGNKSEVLDIDWRP